MMNLIQQLQKGSRSGLILLDPKTQLFAVKRLNGLQSAEILWFESLPEAITALEQWIKER
jgi:hypothetical protein